MTRHVQVTFDAADPHQLAGWWSDLLGYEIESADELVSKLLQTGVIGESDVVRIDGQLFFADLVAAFDPGGKGPRFLFQRVPEQKVAKNRVHLDVPIDGAVLDDEVTRLVDKGARFIEFGEYPGHRWAVMRDPEGNEFCLQ